MRGRAFDLGSRVDLDGVESIVIDAFVGQRERLVTVARGLTSDQWSGPTRCSEWDARELLLHVVGATDSCRETLTGERPVFGGPFDPNATPSEFVDRHAGVAPSTAVELLEASLATTVAAIELRRGRSPVLQVPSIWGEPIDWRLFVAHMFFDGWMHERDLLLPLAYEPLVVGSEARLAAAYSLHIAAIVAGGFGVPLDATLHLGGAADASYRVTANGFDVLVAVRPLDTTDSVSGDAVLVTDAISGRGPALPATLDAPTDVLDALSGVGAFLRG